MESAYQKVLYLPFIAPRCLECESNLEEILGYEMFDKVTLIFDPCFKVNQIEFITQALYLPHS